MSTPTGPGSTDYLTDSTTSSPISSSGTSSGGASEQARQAAGTAKDQAGHVAGVAKDEAGTVAAEVKTQARDLVGELKGHATEQSRSQKDRLATLLHDVSDELDEMASSGDRQGYASEIARQAAGRTRSMSGFVQDREPSDILDELRSFARRRPGTFLLGAAIAGVVAGRLTRGVAAAHDVGPGTGSSGSGDAGYSGYGTTEVRPPAEAATDTGVVATGPAVDTVEPGYGAVPTGTPGRHADGLDSGLDDSRTSGYGGTRSAGTAP